MTDRELLELAAKAAGMNVGTDEGGYDDLKWWNPLTDDGDALRLVVKLGIKITPYPVYTFPKHSVIVSHLQNAPADDADNTWIGPEVIELYCSDPYAATRRAIVRAAAEIGKGMK